jgi:hypothetical protein
MQGDMDAGSGSDIWCWKAMGVSRGLWDMVRGCLRVGLGKEAILHVVRSIQFGVKDDYSRKEEEEEPEDEGGDERQIEAQMQDGVGQVESGSGTGRTTVVNHDVSLTRHFFSASTDQVVLVARIGCLQQCLESEHRSNEFEPVIATS